MLQFEASFFSETECNHLYISYLR